LPTSYGVTIIPYDQLPASTRDQLAEKELHEYIHKLVKKKKQPSPQGALRDAVVWFLNRQGISGILKNLMKRSLEADTPLEACIIGARGILSVLDQPFGGDCEEQWSRPVDAHRGLNTGDVMNDFFQLFGTRKEVHENLRQLDTWQQAIKQPHLPLPQAGHFTQADGEKVTDTEVHKAFLANQQLKGPDGQPFYASSNDAMRGPTFKVWQTLTAASAYRVQVDGAYPEERMFTAFKRDKRTIELLMAEAVDLISQTPGFLEKAPEVVSKVSSTAKNTLSSLDESVRAKALALLYFFPFEDVDRLLLGAEARLTALRAAPHVIVTGQEKAPDTYKEERASIDAHLRLLMEGALPPGMGLKSGATIDFEGVMKSVKRPGAFTCAHGFKGMMAALKGKVVHDVQVRDISFFVREKVMIELFLDCALRCIMSEGGGNDATVPSLNMFGSTDFTSDLDITLNGSLSAPVAKAYVARMFYRTFLLTGRRISSEDFIDGSIFCGDFFQRCHHITSTNTFEVPKPGLMEVHDKMALLLPTGRPGEYSQLMFAMLKVSNMTSSKDLVAGTIGTGSATLEAAGTPLTDLRVSANVLDGMPGIIGLFPAAVQEILKRDYANLWGAHRALKATLQNKPEVKGLSEEELDSMLYSDLFLAADAAYTPLSVEERKKKASAIANKISAACSFNPEAYYSSSAVLHVLCVLQCSLPVSIPSMGFLASMIENFGNAVHTIPEALQSNASTYDGSPTDRTVRDVQKCCKYFFRMADAALRLVGQDPRELDFAAFPLFGKMVICAEKMLHYTKQRRHAKLNSMEEIYMREVALYLCVRYLGVLFLSDTALRNLHFTGVLDKSDGSEKKILLEKNDQKESFSEKGTGKEILSEKASEKDVSEKAGSEEEILSENAEGEKKNLSKEDSQKENLTEKESEKEILSEKDSQEEEFQAGKEDLHGFIQNVLVHCLDGWEGVDQTRSGDATRMDSRTLIKSRMDETQTVEAAVNRILDTPCDKLTVARMGKQGVFTNLAGKVLKSDKYKHISIDTIFSGVAVALYALVKRAVEEYSSKVDDLTWITKLPSEEKAVWDPFEELRKEIVVPKCFKTPDAHLGASPFASSST